LEIAPNDGGSWTALGDIEVERGNLNKAMALFRQGEQVQPDLDEPHFHLGSLYEVKLNDDADAEAEYRSAIALNPFNLVAHFNLGNVLIRRRDYNQAIAQYAAALSVDPDNLAALFNLAQAYASIGDRDDAIEQANAALKIDPTSQPLLQLLQRLGAPP